jgi:hypothetical protein
VSKAGPTATSEWTLDWAIEEMCSLGVLPTDTYLLTVPEINMFLTYRNGHEADIVTTSSWQTINFLGAFLAEKFQNLEKYLPETPKRKKERDAKKTVLKEKLIKISNKR